jgi:hypothetical protein
LRAEAGPHRGFEKWVSKGSLMPIDPTPQGGELTREPSAPEFPQPKPAGEDRPRSPNADADSGKADRPRTDPPTGAGEDIAG